MEKEIFYGSFYMINFDKPCKFHCRSCLPTPHLTYDGFVSCCDMCFSIEIPEVMHKLIYGFWDDDNKCIVYDKEKISAIRTRRIENIQQCKSCEISPYCGGYCIGEVLNETGDFYGVLPERCEAIRFLHSRLAVGKLQIPALHP